MNVRELIVKLMEQGDMDAEVQIKIITRHPRKIEEWTSATESS